jgi:hypothetical protein
LRRLAVELGKGRGKVAKTRAIPRSGDIRPKENHMSISNLPNNQPSVFRSVANLVLSTDVTVVVLWAVTGTFVTTLALSTGFIALLD